MTKWELLDWLGTSFMDFCVLLKLKDPNFKWGKEDEIAYGQIVDILLKEKSRANK